MKLRLITYIILIIVLTGCSNIPQSNIEPTANEATVNYSSYMGDWIYKDKKTLMLMIMAM